MGGSPNYNYPAQPTYGEGMADAMKAQMEMLTGQTLGEGEGFKELYASALGEEGGTLADVLRKFEAPLRKDTAQIDTDVMRQTLLGGSRTADEQGRHQTGWQDVPSSGGEQYQLKLTSTGPAANMTNAEVMASDLTKNQMEASEFGYELLDSDGNVVASQSARGFDDHRFWGPDDARERTGAGEDGFWRKVTDAGYMTPDQVDEIKASDNPEAFQIGGELIERKPIYEKNPDGTDKIYKPGETIRAGEGMVDLLGDTRAV